MKYSNETGGANRPGRAWRRPWHLAALTLPLLAQSAGPVFAHADSPASPPLAPSALRLQHRKPAEIVALFARERLPDASGRRLPRAARVDEAESLVPNGVEAVLPADETDQVMLVGTENVGDLRACIEVVDAPVERTGPDRERVRLSLRRADAGRLRAAVLRLPEAGSAVIKGSELVLEGKPTWLHGALRQVIRAELREPPSMGLPSAASGRPAGRGRP